MHRWFFVLQNHPEAIVKFVVFFDRAATDDDDDDDDGDGDGDGDGDDDDDDDDDDHDDHDDDDDDGDDGDDGDDDDDDDDNDVQETMRIVGLHMATQCYSWIAACSRVKFVDYKVSRSESQDDTVLVEHDFTRSPSLTTCNDPKVLPDDH